MWSDVSFIVFCQQQNELYSFFFAYFHALKYLNNYFLYQDETILQLVR